MHTALISTLNSTVSHRECSTSSDAGQQDESEHTCSIPTSGNSGTSCAQQSSGNSQSQHPVSKNNETRVEAHATTQSNWSWQSSYPQWYHSLPTVAYVSGDDNDDQLVFWGRGLFPSLQHTAKNSLSHSASSVLVERMLSTMGLLPNGKCSTLAPHWANWLTFIYDNYTMYFDTDL